VSGGDGIIVTDINEIKENTATTAARRSPGGGGVQHGRLVAREEVV